MSTPFHGEPPRVWADVLRRLRVNPEKEPQTASDLLAIFDGIGECGNGVIVLMGDNGRTESLTTLRQEWELHARTASRCMPDRDVTWQEMGYWILEEGFASGHRPIDEVLKEAIQAVQNGRPPKLVGQAVIILHSETELASIPSSLVQEIAAPIRSASGSSSSSAWDGR